MENYWALEIQRGWRIGLALMVLLVLLAVGGIVAIALLPLSFWTFVLGIGILVTLIVAARTGYLLWGLVHATYEMDRNAMIVHWGSTRHQIPMSAVRAVLSGADLAELRMRPGLRWPGHFVGYGEATGIGEVLFYATTPPTEQVIVRTGEMAYAISPVDQEAFLQAFRERLEMGPTQDVEEETTYPTFLDWSIWRDRFAWITLVGSAVLLVLLVGLLLWRYPYLPTEIAMRFSPGGDALLVAEASRIFYLSFLGIIFLLINGVLGLFLYTRERIAAYFLWSGLLALEVGLWAAVISILLHQ